MPVKTLLQLHEGLRLKPYQCTANKQTIGYGRNLDDKGVTQSEADLMLDNDIAEVTIELERKLWFMSELDEVRRSVLIDMAFNMGVAGLMKFSITLSHVEDREYMLASVEMLDSKWAREDVGKDRSMRLSNMMHSGEWPPELRGT